MPFVADIAHALLELHSGPRRAERARRNCPTSLGALRGYRHAEPRGWFVVVLVAIAFAVLAASASAHHSVSGQYDSSKPLTLTGVISKVDWINPHIYLHLDVKDKDGAVTTWTLSTLPTAMMRRAGLTKESLQGKPGEVVTINAIAARDETKKLGWISKITYADGHHVQLGRD
jgi:hypothetical protein